VRTREEPHEGGNSSQEGKGRNKNNPEATMRREHGGGRGRRRRVDVVRSKRSEEEMTFMGSGRSKFLRDHRETSSAERPSVEREETAAKRSPYPFCTRTGEGMTPSRKGHWPTKRN